MQTIEGLKKTIASTTDLYTVVKTMKAMAAVNIRQFERAVESLREYFRTVELGLGVALSSEEAGRLDRKAYAEAAGPIGVIVFGSDMGMCGQLNDLVVSHALKTLEKHKANGADAETYFLAIGERVVGRLEEAGAAVGEYLTVPTSASHIGAKVQEILLIIDEWRQREKVGRILLCYCEPLGGARFAPRDLQLLPVEHPRLVEYRRNEWPTNNLPRFTVPWSTLFASLIRQYLFVSLFKALAASLASENASRLASMQGAEKSIKERLEDLQAEYNRNRQMSITEELLDIVAGFEALAQKQGSEEEIT
ncbi:MAG: F0F1 ATP synthase subunit gamma [Desulfurivibrionaceae bacterium]